MTDTATGLERFADNGGLRIRYLDNDPPGAIGLPIVFVPGITDFADDYHAVLGHLPPRRMLVIELRGRGGSDAPPTGYSVPELATDVGAVLAAEGIDRFHLMSFSRGTTPALEVAFGNRDRIATLSIGDYLAAEVALPPAFVDSQWESRWRGTPIPERVARHVLDGIQRDAVGRELWDEVGALGVPVLVARGGGAGGILQDEQVERYRAHVPGVEVVTIPDAGHDLFRPDRLAYPNAVVDFIARRAPGE
jgi:pimeloyl-ACP methyl ester carboxylesterase